MYWKEEQIIASPDYVLYVLSTLLAGIVALLIVRRGQLRSYLALSMYFFATVLANLTFMVIWNQYRTAFNAYAIWSYCSEGVRSLLLYCSIAGLYRPLFQGQTLRTYFYIGTLFFTGSLALIDWLTVPNTVFSRATYWIVQVSSDLFALTFVLALLLVFYGVYKKSQIPRQALQIAAVVAVHSGIICSLYLGRRPQVLELHYYYLPEFYALLLPLGVGYIFSEMSLKQSEDNHSNGSQIPL